MASYTEVRDKWTLEDLMDAHEVMDVIDFSKQIELDKINYDRVS